MSTPSVSKTVAEPLPGLDAVDTPSRDSSQMSRNPSRRRLSMDASLSAATLSRFAQLNDEHESTPTDDDERSVSRIAPPQEGILTVHLKHAKGLQNADTFGLSDPYIVLDVVYADGRYVY